MARSIEGGVFRESMILKSKKKKSAVDKPQPQPTTEEPTSLYTDGPTNGEAMQKREKEEDHYGFLYSISEKDKH